MFKLKAGGNTNDQTEQTPDRSLSIHSNTQSNSNIGNPPRMHPSGMPLNIPDNDENDFLRNFIEIPLDQIDQLQKNDFVRYKNKTDGDIKKGGYVVDIYTRVLKNGEEKTYIKLSFNKTFINNNRFGTFPVSLDNIEKLYKRIENQIEFNQVSNSISGISENFGNDINNIFELLRNKDLEINSLKLDIEELKKDNKKTEDRLRKMLSYIKEVGDRTSNVNSQKK